MLRPLDDIAIVGGGPSAKHLLLTLAHAIVAGRLGRDLRIAVYEQSGACGAGQPWHPDNVDECHLSSLPTPVRRAAVGHDELRRFARTVAFLRELGVTVEVMSSTQVVSLDRIGAHWRLTDAPGTTRTAHHAVLAMGHSVFAPRQPDDGRCVSPWPFRALCAKAAEQARAGRIDVLVLGGYLTAVDVVTGLAAHFGADRARLRIRVLSRSGELPKVWGGEPAAIDTAALARRAFGTDIQGLRTQGRLGLAAFERIALDVAYPDDGPGPRPASLDAWLRHLCTGDAAQRLKSDLALAEGGGPLGWQAALFGCLPVLSESFPYFDDEDKLAFHALRSRYYRAAMPMAQENARQLDMLFDAGVLTVAAAPHGYLVTHDEARDAAYLQLVNADGARQPAGEYGMVVAAAGPDTRLSRTASPLLRHLYRQGTVQAVYACSGGDRVELGGLRVDPSTCETIGTRAQPAVTDGRLFAIGPLVVGTFPDAQSIGQLARDAERIVERLVALSAADFEQHL
ncbi:FAD/NAD(P)-binding protein [Paraburkholderia caledonica]|uniref:NAD(P)/FAD-binding protein YdhS n=1 Tax=Paraburkholderia caledonica TaxID=134536 RepID=A0AB73IIY0_9BURK|nr:putative NAD(P)/FAD-binding protein YdhS [Paraburkholderia caledonica]